MKIVKTWGHSTSVPACKERTQQTTQWQREPQSRGVQHAWLKSRLLYFPQTFQLPNSKLVKTSVVFLGTIHSINNFVISTWLRTVSSLVFSLSPIKYNAKKIRGRGIVQNDVWNHGTAFWYLRPSLPGSFIFQTPSNHLSQLL